MATKRGDCPVCGTQSSLIIRRTAIENRNALTMNQWFDRRMRAGSVIFYDGIRIDSTNYLIRNHKVCTRCLFATSMEDDKELKDILSVNTISDLRGETETRLAGLRNTLSSLKPEELDGMLGIGERLKRKRTDVRTFSPTGRKRILSPGVRNALVKLCTQYLISPASGDLIQKVTSSVFTKGVQGIMEIFFDLPIPAELVRLVFDLENACLLRMIVSDNDILFLPNSPIPDLKDIRRFTGAFKNRCDGLLIRHHMLYAMVGNMLTLSELVPENQKRDMLEMALILAELSMEHEDREFMTEEEKEKRQKRAEHEARMQAARRGKKDTGKPATVRKADIGFSEVEIDPRRVPHNREIVAYVILTLQKTLGNPLNEKLRDRAMHTIRNNDMYSFQGICGAIGPKLEDLMSQFF